MTRLPLFYLPLKKTFINKKNIENIYKTCFFLIKKKHPLKTCLFTTLLINDTTLASKNWSLDPLYSYCQGSRCYPTLRTLWKSPICKLKEYETLLMNIMKYYWYISCFLYSSYPKHQITMQITSEATLQCFQPVR